MQIVSCCQTTHSNQDSVHNYNLLSSCTGGYTHFILPRQMHHRPSYPNKFIFTPIGNFNYVKVLPSERDTCDSRLCQRIIVFCSCIKEEGKREKVQLPALNNENYSGIELMNCAHQCHSARQYCEPLFVHISCLSPDDHNPEQNSRSLFNSKCPDIARNGQLRREWRIEWQICLGF